MDILKAAAGIKRILDKLNTDQKQAVILFCAKAVSDETALKAEDHLSQQETKAP